MQRGSFFSRNLPNLALALASVVVAALLAETAYRVALRLSVRRPTSPQVNFTVYSTSCWENDPTLGFRYKPGVVADWTEVEHGLPTLTGTLAIDSRGNSGPEVDDAGAQARIAVLGDSFTVIQHDGETWPHLLQQLLRERTGRKVAVYNHARDGYGMLQMIDQAAELVDTRPDLILIAFITPDLKRGRFWRTERRGPGGVELFTSTTPELRLDEPETYARTLLIDPRATRSWAERTRAGKVRDDAVLRSLVDVYAREKQNHAITRFDPLSPRVSYLWQRFANPGVRPLGTLNTVFTAQDFSADRRYMDGIARIRRSGVPVYLLHLPWAPELIRGRFETDIREGQLLDSLRITSGFRLVELLPEEALGAGVEKLILSHTNAHPSLEGLRYYAEKTAAALTVRR